MKRSIWRIIFPLAAWVLAACTPVANAPAPLATATEQAALDSKPALEVGATKEPTKSPDELAQPPIDPPATPEAGALSQPVFWQDTVLGLAFELPAGWYTLPAAEGRGVTVSSFDPEREPHKLEWTDQMARMHVRLPAAAEAPMPLEVWLEQARAAASAAHLDVTAVEETQVAGQAAYRLTLVSGSGGVVQQVLALVDGRPVEMLVEGNPELVQPVLDTLRIYPPDGLKPADSETPAAGICAEVKGETALIELGTGPDGLPLAGRCWILPAQARILLVNASQEALHFTFAGYAVDLEPGEERALGRNAGEMLARGAHALPYGPQLWLK
jgi:hypothetical protein